MGISYKIRRIMNENMSNERYDNYVNTILEVLEGDPDIKDNFEVEGILNDPEKHGRSYHYNVDIKVTDKKGEHKLRAQGRRNAVDLIVRARLLEACGDRRWGSYPWSLLDADGAVIKEVENAPPVNRMTTIFPNGESTNEVIYTLQREKQRRTSEKAIPKIIEFWQAKLGEKGLRCAAKPVKPREYQGGWLENLELTVMSDGASINKDVLDNYMGELCNSNRWQGNPYLIVDLENGVGVNLEELPEESEDEADEELFKKYKSVIPFDVAATWQDVRDMIPELMKIRSLDDDGIESHPAFEGVYGLGAHIRVIIDTIVYAAQTDGRCRNHVALISAPGCGKSTLIKHLRKLFPENFFLVINAETASSAGFRKVFLKILSRTGVPPFVTLEECDKPSNEETFSPFLGVFDERAAMQQLNARDAGNVHAPVLGIITINNRDKFQRMLAGAFASRFPNAMSVPMPNDNTIKRILMREVKENNLNPEWVDAAMYVAQTLHEQCKTPKDPRTVQSYLIGGDRLLDGTFLRDQLAVHQFNSDQAKANGTLTTDDMKNNLEYLLSLARLAANPGAGD